MPELPEVHTIVTNLRNGTDFQPALLGLRIASAIVLWERSLAYPTPAEFTRKVIGQRIEDITRRGKFLVFLLTDATLLFHLRMSGDIFVEPLGSLGLPHYRLTINFENGWRLAFNDPRKFGRLWLTSNPGMVLDKLGPEPLDEQFTETDLFQRLHNKHRHLKPLLLDQGFLAGIGNIYADEALHLAHLHPLSFSDTLTLEQATGLLLGIRQVLHEGIQRNGASIDWVYRGGEFQNYFRVYQRTGEPCLRCETPIQRIVVGQRSTHFCPSCQSIQSGPTD